MPVYLRVSCGFPSRRVVLAFPLTELSLRLTTWQSLLDHWNILCSRNLLQGCGNAVLVSPLASPAVPCPAISSSIVKIQLWITNKTSMAGRKERDLLHFSMVRPRMDSILLVIGFCSVLCSFYVLPRLILCNFPLCIKRAVDFLRLSTNIYIKTLDT